MAANLKNHAKHVTNVVEFDGLRHFSFDNGHFAYELIERTCSGKEIKRLVCCNEGGRSFASTGRFGAYVAAMTSAIERASIK
jgi:hypothetical protein